MVLVSEEHRQGEIEMNATATKTRTLCEICNTRPLPSLKVRDDEGMSRDMKYCVPCYTEAGWENSHADGHDAENVDPECWICSPELNEARREYKPREGTSREGMVVHVTIRATGIEKAAEVIKQIPNAESYEAKVTKPTKRNGHVTKLTFASTVQTFILTWDDRGRFIAGTVTENGASRKIRNVAEALRLAA
jgi:hypothetical protein